MLERDEYVEQAYLFRALAERGRRNVATQDLLTQIREEILSITNLPKAIDYMASELRLHGQMSLAMQRLNHYFTPFQAYVMAQAEKEGGRLDFTVALEILERDAAYRGNQPLAQGMFLFQFESMCRNRLGYDQGLAAVMNDPIFNDDWREWIDTVRRQIGLVDFAELIYVRSQHFVRERNRRGLDLEGPIKPVLFGEKEGKIALAHRRKDPLYLFAALERHLGYPTVPRLRPVDESKELIPQLKRRVERVEMRMKLLEEEHRGGLDITKFYGQTPPPAAE